MKKMVVSFICTAALLSSGLARAETLALTLLPNPPVMGKQVVEIRVKDDKGKASKDATIEGEALMPPMAGMGMMKSKIRIDKSVEGSFSGKFNLSMEGTWYLKLKVTTGKTTKDFLYKLTTGAKDVTAVSEIPGESGMGHGAGMEHMNH